MARTDARTQPLPGRHGAGRPPFVTPTTLGASKSQLRKDGVGFENLAEMADANRCGAGHRWLLVGTDRLAVTGTDLHALSGTDLRTYGRPNSDLHTYGRPNSDFHPDSRPATRSITPAGQPGRHPGRGR